MPVELAVAVSGPAGDEWSMPQKLSKLSETGDITDLCALMFSYSANGGRSIPSNNGKTLLAKEAGTDFKAPIWLSHRCSSKTPLRPFRIEERCVESRVLIVIATEGYEVCELLTSGQAEKPQPVAGIRAFLQKGCAYNQI